MHLQLFFYHTKIKLGNMLLENRNLLFVDYLIELIFVFLKVNKPNFKEGHALIDRHLGLKTSSTGNS